MAPDDYSITAYDAALVMIDAVKRVAASGKPVTREAVQAARSTAKVPTIQGTVSFDANGDMADHTISVFQITKDASKPLDETSASTSTSGWRRNPDSDRATTMTFTDLLLQQTINGLSLGAMYALLALGFTLVYGILELINFAHFNVFMVGSFIAMWVLQKFGLSGQDVILTGLPLVGVLLAAFAVTMLASGVIGVASSGCRCARCATSRARRR